MLPSVSSRRYTFQLTEQGNDLEIEIALAPEGIACPTSSGSTRRSRCRARRRSRSRFAATRRRPRRFGRGSHSRPPSSTPLQSSRRPRDRRDARPEGVGSGRARPAAAHPDARAAAAAALRTPRRRVVQLRTERAAAARDGRRREAAATMRSSTWRDRPLSPAAASISGRSRRRSAASAISRRSSRGGWIHDHARARRPSDDLRRRDRALHRLALALSRNCSTGSPVDGRAMVRIARCACAGSHPAHAPRMAAPRRARRPSSVTPSPIASDGRRSPSNRLRWSGAAIRARLALDAHGVEGLLIPIACSVSSPARHGSRPTFRVQASTLVLDHFRSRLIAPGDGRGAAHRPGLVWMIVATA